MKTASYHTFPVVETAAKITPATVCATVWRFLSSIRTRRALQAAALITLVAGCNSDADIASRNLSQAADMFEVNRRVVFYNGITGDYILSIEGLCSLGNNDAAKRLTVTCKTAPGMFKKHFLGLSDNVTFFAEQIDGNAASASRYRVIFKPLSILPAIEVRQ